MKLRHLIIAFPLLLMSCTSNMDEPRCWEITISYERIGNPTDTDYSTTYFYGTEREVRRNMQDWIDAGILSKEYNTKAEYKKAAGNLCNN